MPLEIHNTRDMTTAYLASIVYGEPKVGKTTFACSLGEAPLVIDFDDGVLSVKDRNINYVRPRTWEELLEVVSAIRSNSLRTQIQYDHIIIDSFTFMYTTVMEGVLRVAKRTSPQMQDWGLANERCKMIIEQLVKHRTAGKYHITIICHTRLEKDENTGRIVGSIAATPALQNVLPAMCDELYYLTVTSTRGKDGTPEFRRTINTVPVGFFPAGSRSAGRLSSTEDADFARIYSKIIGS